MTSVFISYSRADVVFARQLATSLAELGADVWIDVEDIEAGVNWSSAIQQGLKHCQVMLVVISPSSMASTNVEDEWQYFLDKRKLIIPVLLAPAEIHFQLNRKQHIDFQTQTYAAALQKLLIELRRKGFEISLPPQPEFHPVQPAPVQTSVIPPSANEAPTSEPEGASPQLEAAPVFAPVNHQKSLDELSAPFIIRWRMPLAAVGIIAVTAIIIFITLKVVHLSNRCGAGSNQIVFTSDRLGKNSIFLMNSDGSHACWLTDNTYDYLPTWSPDGSQIAFETYRDGNSEIYVMNADGSNPRNISNNLAFDASPAWSPDGLQIAFETNRDGNSEIYVMNDDGSNPRNITNSLQDEFRPTWSPDGLQIAFETNRDGNSEIYVMNDDGSNPRNITNNPSRDESPAWSPDGLQIAFSSFRDGNSAIYIMNDDGSNPRNITNNPLADEEPVWSPDGLQIAFSSFRDGNNEIYVMNIDGSDQHNLTNQPTIEKDPSWRPTPKT